MPWKAGRSLLQISTKIKVINNKSLNALESGPVIVTLRYRRETFCPACLNALESGPVIVTDPILEAGGSKAREPQIANLPWTFRHLWGLPQCNRYYIYTTIFSTIAHDFLPEAIIIKPARDFRPGNWTLN